MPISFSDPQSGEDLAAANIAIGEPSTIGENFAASFHSNMLNSRFVGEQTSMENVWDEFNEKVFRSSGVRLPNPQRGEMPAGVPVFGVGDETGSLAVSRDIAIQAWQEESRKLGFEPPTVADMEKRARAKRYGAEQANNEVASRASGFGPNFGQFAGSMAAISTDPPVLLSMGFGGSQAATVLRAMGQEALVAGTAEAFVQPQVQRARQDAGLPGGFREGAENVAFATGGAAGLTAVFRGASASFRALRDRVRAWKPGTAAERDAARYAERYASLQQENPLSETAAGAAEHVERVSVAQKRMYDLEPDSNLRVSDRPSAPVRREPVPDSPKTKAPASDSPIASAGQSLGERLRLAAQASEQGADDLARARETADAIAGGLDDGTLDLARGSKPVPPRDDPSLVQFIVAKGGINDADRSLGSIGVTPRRRPGLISKTGMSASRMSELAAEAGYFPPSGAGEGGRLVDQRELATAILDELDGQKLYARHGHGGNVQARIDYDHAAQLHADMNHALSELGIDPRKMTNDEIRDAVESVRAAGAPEKRLDMTAEAIARSERSAADLDAIADMEERLAIATENDLREIYRNRMDETIYLEIDGEVRAVTARDVFAALESDNRLVTEFGACVNGVPF